MPTGTDYPGCCEITEADYYASEREADRLICWCVTGTGHPIEFFIREPKDLSVGIMTDGWFCDLCGSNLTLLPDEDDEPYYDDEGFYDHEPPNGWEP